MRSSYQLLCHIVGLFMFHGPAPTLAELLRQHRQTIVGGSQITDRTRFPFLAYSSGSPSCGATLIWNDILLSAGHCIDAFINQGVRIGGIEGQGKEGEYHDVEQVLVHPDYPDASTQPNDIMLVKISSPSSIEHAVLATSAEQPDFGSILKILGFGLLSEDGDFSPYAKEVDVNVVDFSACDDLYGGKLLENVQFCTESANGDSCQGDSGGPLLNQNGEQVGVVAFGEGCHRYPSVNTRVSSFSSWIHQGICDLSSNPPVTCLALSIFPPPATSPTTSTTTVDTPTISNPLQSKEEDSVILAANATTVTTGTNATDSRASPPTPTTTTISEPTSSSFPSLHINHFLYGRGALLLLGSIYLLM